MSFNRSRTVFTCEPDCPGRKPGCHGRCKKYNDEREEHLRNKHKEDVDKILDDYFRNCVAKARDARAKRHRSFAGHSWAHRDN